MSLQDELLGAFETHDAREIARLLAAGVSAVEPIQGKTPLLGLVEMYLRSPRFADCVRVLLKSGASFDDPLLEALLLDDAQKLNEILKANPESIHRRFHLECSFTPLCGVTALHVCAEYNSLGCARVLLEAGLSVNERAEVDANGWGGQTALFHTVNSLRNFARPTMELLVEAGADLDVRLKGLLWGAGFAWETAIVDVTPLSYAQCGLYFQFHRGEEYIYDNLKYLYVKKYKRALVVNNVPNKYLNDPKVYPPRI